MSNVKISGLTAYTNPASSDVLPIVDLLNDQTKKITVADLLKNGFGPGTVALPSFSFIGDPDTGIYSPGANQFAVTTGGTQRLLIDASGNTTIQGDLTVNGTTTTVSSNTLSIKDKNIEIAVVSTPSDTTADGGGITLKGASDKTLTWVNSTDCWTFNQGLNLTAGTAGAPALVFNGDVNSGLFQPGADSLAIATAGAQRITVDSGGQVGIGKTPQDSNSFTRALDISGSSGSALYVRTAGSGTNYGLVGHYGTNLFLRNQANGAIKFQTNAADAMQIDSAGRLLVGTTTAYGSSDNFVVQKTDGGARIGLQRSDTGQVTAGEELGAITFYSNDGDLNPSAQISAQADLAHAASDKPGRLTFSTTADGASSPTERMQIDSSGRLLAGTTTAGFASYGDALTIERPTHCGMTLRGGTTSDTELFFADGTTGTARYAGGIRYAHSTDHMQFTVNANERMRIDSSGRLLVGTTNAVAFGSRQVLAVANGTTGGVLSLYNSTTATANTRISSNPTGSEINDIGIHAASTNGSIIAYTNNDTERMRITSSGNVAVGMTSNVQGKLSVFSGTDFTTASQGGNDNIYLVSGSTSGNNVYGASISFSRVQYPDRRAAAIASVQTSADVDKVGLAFFTHSSTTAADPIVEAMRLDSSGRLLLNTTTEGHSDADNLTIADSSKAGITIRNTTTTGDGAIFFSDATSGTGEYSGYIEYGHSGNHLRFATSSAERMRIDSSGNLFIGGTSDANADFVFDRGSRASFYRTLYIGGANSAAAKIALNTDGSATFNHFIQSTRFATRGALGVNVNGTDYAFAAFDASSNLKASVDLNGSAIFAGSVTASNVSDIRFKENITDANPQLADTVALGSQLKNFDWNDDAPLNEELRAKRFLGLVAQEAEKVCPGLTYTVPRTKQGKELTPAVLDEEGNETKAATYEELDDSYKAINHDILVMKLLGAVAELSAKVAALEAG